MGGVEFHVTPGVPAVHVPFPSASPSVPAPPESTLMTLRPYALSLPPPIATSLSAFGRCQIFRRDNSSPLISFPHSFSRITFDCACSRINREDVLRFPFRSDCVPPYCIRNSHEPFRVAYGLFGRFCRVLSRRVVRPRRLLSVVFPPCSPRCSVPCLCGVATSAPPSGAPLSCCPSASPLSPPRSSRRQAK